MFVLSRPEFHDEAAAFAHLETVLWPNGPTCPHCGNCDAKRIGTLTGKTTRLGLKKCYACRKPFTVKVGTVFESAHIPLHKMLQAVFLLSSSKKGISAHQLHRVLEITYKAAWFLAHRIREAMRAGKLPPLGGEGAMVEADETFIGRKKGMPKRRGYAHKNAVLALVERGGAVRTFHVNRANVENVQPIVEANVRRESRLMTDEAAMYERIGKSFAGHEAVRHSQDEYVRGDAHTNTLEGYLSIFKRGMKSVYQHCGEQYLHRYLAEYEFRYNHRIARGLDDAMRATQALNGIVGKRLMYRDS